MTYHYNLNNIDESTIKFNGIGIDEVILVSNLGQHILGIKMVAFSECYDSPGVQRNNHSNNCNLKKVC